MSNIQQNLNALLGIGAVAARTSDIYQRNAQYNALKKQVKINKKINDTAFNRNGDRMGEGTGDIDTDYNPVLQAAEQESYQKLADTQKKMAEIKGKKKDIDAHLNTLEEKDKSQQLFDEGRQEMERDIEQEENDKLYEQAQKQKKEDAINEVFNMKLAAEQQRKQQAEQAEQSRLEDAYAQEEARKQALQERFEFFKSKGLEISPQTILEMKKNGGLD